MLEGLVDVLNRLILLDWDRRRGHDRASMATATLSFQLGLMGARYRWHSTSVVLSRRIWKSYVMPSWVVTDVGVGVLLSLV